MAMRTVDESGTLSLVRQIYETVEAPDGWERLLAALSKSFNARVGTLDVYDTARKQGNVAASVNLDPRFGQAIRPGRPLIGQMLVPDDVLFRSESIRISSGTKTFSISWVPASWRKGR
jgi:uncharacterized protein YigA (DUF484 family)